MTTDYWREIDAAAKEFCNIDPITLAAMIKSEEKLIAETERTKDAIRGSDRREWLRLHLKSRHAITRQAGMERRMAIDFGTAHGWTLSRSDFGLRTLAAGKQHDGG